MAGTTGYSYETVIFFTLCHVRLCNSSVSRQEFWRALLCPPPGDLPNPGTEARSPALQVDSLPPEPPGEPILHFIPHVSASLSSGESLNP